MRLIPCARLLPGTLVRLSPTHPDELADLLRAAPDHPRVEARAGDMAAAKGRYFGQGSPVTGLSRFEETRMVGIFTPRVGTSPTDTHRDISRKKDDEAPIWRNKSSAWSVCCPWRTPPLAACPWAPC
jgi:hypothetical protein